MKCKNCGHEIEEPIPLTGLPEESKFLHVSDIPYYREVKCWCDCQKPEPLEGEKQ